MNSHGLAVTFIVPIKLSEPFLKVDTVDFFFLCQKSVLTEGKGSFGTCI